MGAAVVSVIIPGHAGREHVIRRAVSSSFAQESDSVALEIIVVDDGSPDSAVAKAVADLPVTCVRLDVNGGPAVSRQAGVEASTGDWVVFLDSDDEIVPGRFDHQLRLAGEANADVVGGLARGDPEERNHVVIEDYLATRTTDQMIDSPWGAALQPYLIRGSIARKVGFDPVLRQFEDWDFLYRVGLEAPTIVSVPEIMTEMHGDADNRVSHNAVDGAAGLSYLFWKHHAAIRRTRARAGYWSFVVAASYRRAEDPRGFRRWAMRSLCYDPFHPRRAFELLKGFAPSRAVQD
jgi:succinoglycan biosynthesis protein ExoO